MKQPKWVRGKALETLLALNGLQVGDEIKATRPGDMERGRWVGERTAVIDTVYVSDENGFIVSVSDCPCSKPRYCGAGLQLRAEDIKAWRRPVVDK
jgi:hypothetical protein